MACLLAGSSIAAGPRPDRRQEPSIQLKLAALGYPGTSTALLNVGASMLTVHLVDDDHALLTFSLRKLVPRIAGDPPDHDDRLVAAELIDLPTGKVLAQTEWHLHDHLRYLWKLGQGRFLVRIGQRLYTFAPLANLAAGKAFDRVLFPGRAFNLALLELSADNSMLTLESEVPVGPRIENGDAPAHMPTRTILDFYRLHGTGAPADPLIVANAGSVQAPQPFFLPLDADGLLWAEDDNRGTWHMTFDAFGGKTAELGPLDSSCRPRLEMASHSQFMALTCRGADDRIKLSAYGLDGHETWEENLGGIATPVFAFAPAAGRFAMSFTIAAIAPPAGLAQPSQGSAESQELRVYQTESGDLLFKLPANPVFKTAENFDLSADGLELATIRGDTLAVYRLAPPSKRDREDLAEVDKFAPPLTQARVSLERLMRRHVNTGADDLAGSGEQPAAAQPADTPSATAATTRPTTRQTAAAQSADTQSAAAPTIPTTAGPVAAVPSTSEDPTGPRKRPTLLNPGEVPEFRPKGQSPN